MCVKDYFSKNKGLLVNWMIFEFMCAIALVMWSYFMKNLYDVLVNKGLGNIWNLVFWGIFFIVIFFTSSYLSEYNKASFLNKCNLMIKEDLYYSIINKSMNSFNESNTASYISIMNNDVRILEEKYFGLIPTIAATYMLTLIAGVTMIVYNPMLGIITMIINIAPIGISYLIGNDMSQKRKEYARRLEDFNSNIKDIFIGFDVIKTFNAEKRIGEMFHKINNNTEKQLLDLRNREAFINSFMMSINYLTSVVQLVLSVYFIIIGRIDMGILLGIMQISNYVSNPVSQLSQYMIQYKSVKSIQDKINLILTDVEVEQDNKKRISSVEEINLKKVAYKYSDEKIVINDISFKFEKGKKYAIVGRSGCGKSTLIKLMMAYYTEYAGSIQVDGCELRDIDKKDLYREICCIGQNIMLFEDSVKNNITMFQDYSDDQVEKVIDMVGLRDVIDTEKDGIYSVVKENGKNFSGGEKQRIAIARALIRNTPIIIMDEATSSLDNENASDIENYLLDIEKITSIVITHKLNQNILKKYDEIIVMADGTIAEHGKFDFLMEKEGLFYNLYRYGM